MESSFFEGKPNLQKRGNQINPDSRKRRYEQKSEVEKAVSVSVDEHGSRLKQCSSLHRRAALGGPPSESRVLHPAQTFRMHQSKRLKRQDRTHQFSTLLDGHLS